MAKLEYFLMAESVSVDQLTNRVSIFNVMENVHVQRVGQTCNAVAIAHWNLADAEIGNDFQIEIHIEQDGAEPIIMHQNFRAIRKKHRTLGFFGGFPLTPGTMTVSIRLNGLHQASHQIDVQVVEPEALP